MSAKTFKSFMAALRLEGKAPETLRVYEKCLRRFEEYIEEEGLEMNGDAMLKFLTYLSEEAKLQPATRTQFTVVLKRYYNFLEVKYPKIKTPRIFLGQPKHLSRDDFLKLYESTTDNLEFRAMLSTDYSTGMRISELISRRLSDLDMDKKQIFVHGKTPDDSDATLPLNATAIHDLQEWFSYRLSKGFPPLQKSDFIFHRPEDSSMEYSRSTATVYLYKYCKLAGVPRISWHKVRHSMATHLREDKVPLWDIKDILRHKDIKTTQRYARSDPETLRESTKGKGVLK